MTLPLILGIDPGPVTSGVVLYDPAFAGKVVAADATMGYPELMVCLETSIYFERECVPHIACEMIANMGMAVGKEVFETCVQIGRISWAIERKGREVQRIKRTDIKLAICGTARAKDPNIRQALIDKIGSVGTKKNPGPLYGVTSHAWSALAVAVVASDLLRKAQA
jgi:hypothetical protein